MSETNVDPQWLSRWFFQICMYECMVVSAGSAEGWLLVESEDLPTQLKELPKLEEQRLQELETNLNNKKEI